MHVNRLQKDTGLVTKHGSVARTICPLLPRYGGTIEEHIFRSLNASPDRRLAENEVSLCRRWAHLHSLAITGLVLVPEHNFLLSMGNDGACRVLDYLQVPTVYLSKANLKRCCCCTVTRLFGSVEMGCEAPTSIASRVWEQGEKLAKITRLSLMYSV